MRTVSWLSGLAVVVLTLVLTSTASADRLRMRRMPRIRSTGTRGDITVPYITNGRSNFGVYQAVYPRIYSAPVVNQPSNPGARPVFNLPFYGGKMGFSGRSTGAGTRPSLTPQPIHH